MRAAKMAALGLSLALSTLAHGQSPDTLPLTSRPTLGFQEGGQGVPRPGEPARPLEAPASEPEGPRWGPTMPEDLDCFKLAPCCPDGPPPRFYGWLDSGYTYARKSGPLAVEPRENRFGREYLVNQIALVLDQPLKKDEFSLGYNATLYGGADAALLRPRGGFTTTDPRFGVDFRNLYVSAHLPILTEGGVDIKAGRMGTIIGYESALAPYRPFYSNDYQWFYAEDGAFTGALATWHVNKQLDIVNGITMGANTFFTLRASGPCYIGQINYWLQEDKRTLLSASVYAGDQSIFAAPGLAGDFATNVELRVQHDWNKYLTQIVQSDMGWDRNVPGVGTGSWYSLYTIMVLHATQTVDINFRQEWFDDVQGTRTGVKNNYYETTLGLDFHPTKWLRLRPEVRYDWANNPAFGRGNDRNQFTAAFEALIQF